MPKIVGLPVAASVEVVVVSSSRTTMVALPNAVPSRVPAMVMSRSSSAVELPTAVTVTSTEVCPAVSVTWWPVVFPSVSAGVTA